MRRIILSVVVLLGVCLLVADTASARGGRRGRCCYQSCYVSSCCGCWGNSCNSCNSCSGCYHQPSPCGCQQGHVSVPHHHAKPPVKEKAPEVPKAPPPVPAR
jgi:hypothetical protein